jgi:hypothetical protein
MTRGIRKRGARLAIPLILLASAMSGACSKASNVTVVDDELLADETLVSAWPAYGGTHYERRFSPLTDVNADNVERAEVTGTSTCPRDVGLVSTPLVVDGVLYFVGDHERGARRGRRHRRTALGVRPEARRCTSPQTPGRHSCTAAASRSTATRSSRRRWTAG